MVWDKWTPGGAARSLLMAFLGCVGWHLHCGPDGESMAGGQMPVFSLLVALVWDQMHRRAELGPLCQPHVAASFSPMGYGAGDTGRWPHQTFHPRSCFWSLWDVNHKLEFCFPGFPRSSAPSGMALHGGKTSRSGCRALCWLCSAPTTPNQDISGLTPPGHPAGHACVPPSVLTLSQLPAMNGI